MTWTPTGLHHIAIETLKFDDTVNFYTEFLGFRSKATWEERPKRIAMLELSDGHRLEVFEREHLSPRLGGAIIHFALQTNDCRAALNHVRAAGFRITGEAVKHEVQAHPQSFSAVVGFFEGPNGEAIEFIESDWL
ncbi:MAG: VOC family protein [Devosia sp.]